MSASNRKSAAPSATVLVRNNPGLSDPFWLRGEVSRRSFLAAAARVGGLAVAGGGLVGILEACAGSSTTGTSLQHLVVASTHDADTLDPGVTGLVATGQMVRGVFDSLMWDIVVNGTNNRVPGLAQSYTVSPDATTYTFHLRQGIKFHDGTPFNAQAVKATFDHIIDPATKSLSAIGLLGPYKTTNVIDDNTAEVVFSAPNPPFDTNMSQVALGISSPTALTKYGSDYSHHPVGTGPFIFKEWVEGDHVTLTRNPDYTWGPSIVGAGPATIDQLTFRILTNPTTQYNAFLTGEVAIAQQLNPQDILTLQKNSKYKAINVPWTGLPYSVMVNAEKPPTDDLRVRQALEYGTNQAEMVKTLNFDLVKPANSIFSPVTPGYSTSQAIYSYDPVKAGSLLDSAGWTMGSDGKRHKNGQAMSMLFIIAASFGFDGIAQLMQSQFGKLGITVNLVTQSFPAVGARMSAGDQNLNGFFYSVTDPSFVQALFSCNQIATGFNWEHYCSPPLDQQITQASTTGDATSRNSQYQQIATELMQAAVIIPIYNYVAIWDVPASIKGLAFDLSAQPLFYKVTV